MIEARNGLPNGQHHHAVVVQVREGEHQGTYSTIAL